MVLIANRLSTLFMQLDSARYSLDYRKALLVPI
jgi:hypothetical protein